MDSLREGCPLPGATADKQPNFWHTVDAMVFSAGKGLLLALALLGATHLAAQKTVKDPAAAVKAAAEVAQAGFPLRGIQIVGNQYYSSEQIIKQAGLKIGDSVTPADFQRGLERLNDAGVFHSVEFRYAPADGGYRLTYTVQEVEELYQFRADGFDLPAEEINQMLTEKVPLFGEKVPPTGTMVDRIGNALQAFWKSQGHDSDVRGRLVPLGDNGFEMLFQPESAINTIAYVKFDNAGVLSPLDLQRIVQPGGDGRPLFRSAAAAIARIQRQAALRSARADGSEILPVHDRA